jgi:hypothetical protein
MHDLALALINFVADLLLAIAIPPLPTLRQPRKTKAIHAEPHDERPAGPAAY